MSENSMLNRRISPEKTNEYKIKIGSKGFIFKQPSFESFVPYKNIIKIVKEEKEEIKGEFDFKIYFEYCYRNGEIHVLHEKIITVISITEEEYNGLIDYLMSSI